MLLTVRSMLFLAIALRAASAEGRLGLGTRAGAGAGHDPELRHGAVRGQLPRGRSQHSAAAHALAAATHRVQQLMGRSSCPGAPLPPPPPPPSPRACSQVSFSSPSLNTFAELCICKKTPTCSCMQQSRLACTLRHHLCHPGRKLEPSCIRRYLPPSLCGCRDLRHYVRLHA